MLFFTVSELALASSDDLLFGGQQEQVGENIGLGEKDPRVVVASVIRVALGFLGIIAVVLIMYAGWLYMTADGEEDKIEKAKKILIGAVIGLTIIMASFGIVTFLLNKAYEATGGNSNSNTDPVIPPNPDNETILTSSFLPPHNSDSYPMNTIGSVNFNKNTIQNSGSFSSVNALVQYRAVNVRQLEFNNNETCAVVGARSNISVPSSFADKFCFDPAVQYEVEVSGYKSEYDNLNLSCGLDGLSCQSKFKVKAEFDVTAPSVVIGSSQAMCAGGAIQVFANAQDDYGVSEIVLTVKDKNGIVIAVSTSTPSKISKKYTAHLDLSEKIKINGDYIVSAVAKDIVGLTGSTVKTVTVWPSHCCNFELDGVGDDDLIDDTKPETDIDCGGECGACEGGACAVDMTRACAGDPNNCSTNLCSDSLFCNCEGNNDTNCTKAGYLDINGNPYGKEAFSECCICRSWPKIQNVSPSGGGVCVDANGLAGSTMTACFTKNDCPADHASCDLFYLKDRPNGAPGTNGTSGTMVTISGSNFGDNAGVVFFCKNYGVGGECSDWTRAALAEEVNKKCVNSWTDEQVVVVVPSGAISGPIQLETADKYKDYTNDNWGKYINDFWVNDFERPGICQIKNNNISSAIAGKECESDADCAPYRCLGPIKKQTCSVNQGFFEEKLNYDGLNLTNGTKAYFGDFYEAYSEALVNSSLFTGTAGTAVVPNIVDSGKTTTFTIYNNLLSNNLVFYKIVEPNSGPKILFFDPIEGTKDTYMTIHGQGFGYPAPEMVGKSYKVFFDNDNDDSNLGTPGSFDFPEICQADGLWRDDTILVKVPNLANDGAYRIVLKVDSWDKLVDSSEVDEKAEGHKKKFDYGKKYPLAPGLCSIKPRVGQRNDSFVLYGEGFGTPISHQTMFGIKKIVDFVYAKEKSYETISSAVPSEALDGKNMVMVIKKSDKTCEGNKVCDPGWTCYQNKCQAQGNSLSFKIGQCANDKECSAVSFCCESGSSIGKCVESNGLSKEKTCNKSFGSCVYTFDVNTGDGLPGEEVESCIGYGMYECGYNFCPNSPGWCSYNKSKVGQESNKCDAAYCKELYPDKIVDGKTIPGAIGYDENINRCIDGEICDLSQIIPSKINVEKYCSNYNNIYYEHYNLSGGSCDIARMKFGGVSSDWVDIGGDVCVKKDKDSECSACRNETKCFEDDSKDNKGVCAIDKKVCADGFTCKSGKCTNSDDKTTNNCDDAYCRDKILAGSVYNQALNRCVVTNTNCDIYQSSVIDTAEVVTGSKVTASISLEKYCGAYNGQGKFHYKVAGGSCEIAQKIFGGNLADWVNVGNNTCVNKTDSKFNCDLCLNSAKCFDDGNKDYKGVCAYDKEVCSSGYVCENSVCKKTKAPCCECCCDINKNNLDGAVGNPGCCAPLTCGDDCGSGGIDKNNDQKFDNVAAGDIDFGSCMGCTVKNGDGTINTTASDNACNCSNSNISGKYCETGLAGGKGVCRDCASLQKQATECTKHGTCCVDFKKDNDCRGLGSIGTVGGDFYNELKIYNFNKDAEGWKDVPPEVNSHNFEVVSGNIIFGCTGQNCTKRIEKDGFDFRVNDKYRLKIKLSTYSKAPNDFSAILSGSNDVVISLNNANFNALTNEFIVNYSDNSVVRNKLALEIKNSSVSIDYVKIEKYVQEVNYCGYYNCSTDANSVCLPDQPVRDGKYKTTNCDNQCGAEGGVRLGAECKIIVENDYKCSYDICQKFYCLDILGNELQKDANGDWTPCADGTCGNCCCDPSKLGSDSTNLDTYDKCRELNPNFPNLVCKPNQTPCSGDFRGLCCGCTKDDNCSSGAPTNVGCGDEGCCRARPEVEDGYYPENSSAGICRNTLITATFNQRMDNASLPGNIFVVGDYGVDICPANTTYLTYENGQFKKDNLLVKTYKRILYTINKVFKPILGKDAFAVSNYCAVEGTTTAYDNNLDLAKKTTINFSPKHLLDKDRDFYVIIKGDKNLDSTGGVLNFYGIGMFESNDTLPLTTSFNGQEYANSKIWKFRTGATLCNFDYVDIVPDKYVFKLEDNEDTVRGKLQNFQALAKTNENKKAPIVATVEYNWRWDWSVDNPSIINFPNPPGNQIPNSDIQPIVAQNQVDAATYLRAKATVTATPPELTSLLNSEKEGSELVRVFACRNPWPPIVNGQWDTWKDEKNNCISGTGSCNNTNYEIYYCRDSKGAGTSDDLPSILSKDPTTMGLRLKCSASGGDCNNKVEGATCGNSGKCIVDVLKESYFFRAELPGTVINLATSSPDISQELFLKWTALSPPPKEVLKEYKIYYGEMSGKYTKTMIILAPSTSAVVKNLVNNKKYYLVVTGIFESGAESEYSNELIAIPRDTQKPAAPSADKITVSVSPTVPGTVNTQWDFSDYVNKNEILNFKISYGLAPDCNGQSFNANKKNNKYELAIEKLNVGVNYCLNFQVVDLSGNISDPVKKYITKMAEPDLDDIVIEKNGNTINIEWDSSDYPNLADIKNFRINYGVTPSCSDNNQAKTGVRVGNIFSTSIGGYVSGSDYCLGFFVSNNNGNVSNEVRKQFKF